MKFLILLTALFSQNGIAENFGDAFARGLAQGMGNYVPPAQEERHSSDESANPLRPQVMQPMTQQMDVRTGKTTHCMTYQNGEFHCVTW